MPISAKQVMELRKATDCGMMECKKALQETCGDHEKAVDYLRKKGAAKAQKAASRIATDGVIAIKLSDNKKSGVMLEVNCETDFVARDGGFKSFVDELLDVSLQNKVCDVETLVGVIIKDGNTVENERQKLITKIGENISIRRVAFVESSEEVGAYVHGGRIGVLVMLHGGDDKLRKDVAMHIAASKPIVVSSCQVSEKVVAKEKEIYLEQARESGKSEAVIEKMVEGKTKKFLNESSLEGQVFVKQPDITVGQLLKDKCAKVETFVRFELGEGIEKRQVDFAREVMEQIN